MLCLFIDSVGGRPRSGTFAAVLRCHPECGFRNAPGIEAGGANDTATFRLLLDRGAEVRGPAGEFALSGAASYGPAGRKEEFAGRIERAAAWLRNASPLTAEDRNLQLLGLVWSGARREISEPYASNIVSLQRQDGGWAQTDYLGSDAYATGQTLSALAESGIAGLSESYRKGSDFLLKTQLADGSWHVASRAPKFQPFFEGGFPHGHDQWISMAATAWATMGLAQTFAEPKTIASK